MATKFSGDLAVTGNDDADQLLNNDPLALLLGMLLDQQIPMEWAFKGPYTLLERLGELDTSLIASMEPSEFESICKEKPAIHRFPSSMAGRIQDLCQHLVENYDGDAERLWADSDSGESSQASGVHTYKFVFRSDYIRSINMNLVSFWTYRPTPNLCFYGIRADNFNYIEVFTIS